MRKLILFLFFLPYSFLAQNESAKWYFGNSAALDFISGAPISITTNTTISTEGSASISDSLGNLLFFTNGNNIWNKNNVSMITGSYLQGNPSTTQSSLILRKPGSLNLYYVFTLGDGGAGTLAYSIVDMSLNGGTGSIVVNNYTLTNGLTEKLTGTLHCNSKDYWIVCHKYNSSDFYSFVLTSAGVNTVPVISTCGSVHVSTSSSTSSYVGAMKISPTGKKLGLVVPGYQSFVEVFDFNPSTGQVSNAVVIESGQINNYYYGCEFSSDGTKFYAAITVGALMELHQWDLCVPNYTAIPASMQITFTQSPTPSYIGSMQLASNKKIYIAQLIKTSIGIILNPNQSGTGSNALANGLSLVTGTCNYGLPNFNNDQFRDKANFTSSISTCGLNFSIIPANYCAHSSFSITGVKWRFGDPSSGSSNTSTQMNPQHNYSANGVYSISLVVNYACYSDSIAQTVTVTTIPTVQVTGKNTICKGESTTFTLGGFSSYSINSVASSSIAVLSPTVNTSYNLIGTSSVTGCSSKSTFTVGVSTCKNIPDYWQKPIIEIFPNPTQKTLSINTDSKYNVKIYDITGKVFLLQNSVIGNTELELGEFQKGMYFIEFTFDTNYSVVKKLLLQ